MTAEIDRETKLKEFISELEGFAGHAERALKLIEIDPHGQKGQCEQFSEMMIAIRGTSVQLGLSEIAEMAGLGEEIAVKVPGVSKGALIKKCVAALWDALTTVRHLLQHPDEKGDEERDILKNRLQATLRSVGGARETVSEDEIERLLRGGN